MRLPAYRLVVLTLLCFVLSFFVARRLETGRRVAHWTHGYADLLKLQAAEALRAGEITRRALEIGDPRTQARAHAEVGEIEETVARYDRKLVRWLERKPTALSAEERHHLASLRGGMASQ